MFIDKKEKKKKKEMRLVVGGNRVMKMISGYFCFCSLSRAGEGSERRVSVGALFSAGQLEHSACPG